MAAGAITKGNITVRERPDSPEWDFGTQKVSCTRTFEGMYADLLAGRPLVGDEMDGYQGLYIENVKIKRAVSGKATMTVVLQVDTVSQDQFPSPVQPVYEIEWTQLEKPIEQHPVFKTLFPDPDGVIEFTPDQVTALTNFRAWENAGDARTAQDAYNLLTTGAPGFQQLAQRKMRGQSTYLLFAPVARITTLARNVTQANQCGVIFTSIAGFPQLPQLTGGQSYIWLATADRSTRTGTSGKWQRVQEWTGADEWDGVLYAVGSGENQGGGGGEGDGGDDGGGDGG
jgi:hypothetical protein